MDCRSQSSGLSRLGSSRGPGGFSESPVSLPWVSPHLVQVPLRVSELGLQEETRDQENIERGASSQERHRVSPGLTRGTRALPRQVC